MAGRGLDGQILHGNRRHLEADVLLVHGIDAVSERAVDPAAIVLLADNEARREHIVDDGQVDRHVGAVVAAAAVGGGTAGAGLEVEIVQLCIVGEHPHHAVQRARAVQRALRSAQHFDVVQVIGIQVRFHRGSHEAERHRIEVVADGARAGEQRTCGGHAAYREQGFAALAGDVDGDARYLTECVRDALKARLVEIGAGRDGHRDGHVLQALLALLRRDDDLLEAGRFGCCIIVRGSTGGGCRKRGKQKCGAGYQSGAKTKQR